MLNNKKLKDYEVDVELDIFTIRVKATSIGEARRKALSKLKNKNIINLIRRHWPSNKRMISVNEL